MKLDRFSKGPKSIVDKLNSWADVIEKNWPLPGFGVEVQQSPSGTTIGAFGGGASSVVSPFHVYTRVKPGSPIGSPTYEAGVYANSYLFKSKRPTDFVEGISGIFQNDPPDPSDEAWFTLEKTDLIWLEIVLDAEGYFESASIESWGQHSTPDFHAEADPFELGHLGEDGYVLFTHETDSYGNTLYNQTHARLLIASSHAVDDKPFIISYAATNYILKNMTVGPNFPALVPEPYPVDPYIYPFPS